MELTSNMVLSGFKFSELSRYCWFLQPCHLWSSDCTFLQRAVLGKDPASPRPDAQRLMFDVFSFLLHSVGFMPLYTSWYFDPFWEGMCICVFCVVFPSFGEGCALQWGWGYMTETHAEFFMRHQPCANIGLNICQNLSLWITVLQMYSILYSTSWQTHSLIVHLVKNPHISWLETIRQENLLLNSQNMGKKQEHVKSIWETLGWVVYECTLIHYNENCISFLSGVLGFTYDAPMATRTMCSPQLTADKLMRSTNVSRM